MEYWYLWVIFALLCVATAFVLHKASRALHLHNDEKEKAFREIERYKALKEEFRDADPEKARETDPETLLTAMYAILEARLERADNPDACFVSMTAAQQYAYTMHYFLEDVDESLSHFFHYNGEPMRAVPAQALEAIGEPTLAAVVQDMYAMFDESREDVSLDTQAEANYDRRFLESYDRARVLEHCKRFITENLTEILSA